MVVEEAHSGSQPRGRIKCSIEAFVCSTSAGDQQTVAFSGEPTVPVALVRFHFEHVPLPCKHATQKQATTKSNTTLTRTSIKEPNKQM